MNHIPLPTVEKKKKESRNAGPGNAHSYTQGVLPTFLHLIGNLHSGFTRNLSQGTDTHTLRHPGCPS